MLTNNSSTAVSVSAISSFRTISKYQTSWVQNHPLVTKNSLIFFKLRPIRPRTRRALH
jgi:hypothetical protein